MTWNNPPTGEMSGTNNVSVSITASTNIIASELLAIEPANGTHAAINTQLTTAITHLGSFPPNYYFYSVNYDWNSLGCHNGDITLKLRLQLSGGSWEEYTRSVTVNNLSFGTASQDIIKWKDEASQTSETVTVPVNGKSLTGVNITVNLKIYDCAGATDSQTNLPVLVRTLTQSLTNPATASFTWDGKDSSGNPVMRGLYSFDIEASRMQGGSSQDIIKYRSDTLKTLRGVDSNGQPIYDVEYIGVDDNGTPTNQTDDKVLYVVRSYIAMDLFGATANSTSKIVLYDPDLNTKGEWNINTLKCRAHSMAMDGCTTSNAGLPHEVIVPVPVGTFNPAGHYKYVIDMKDALAGIQRWHANRSAIQVNCTLLELPIKWVDFSASGWKGAWGRAEYIDVIRKSWKSVPSDRNLQLTKVTEAYMSHPSLVRASINGGYFDNSSNVTNDEYSGLSKCKGAVKSKGRIDLGTTVLGNAIMREGVVAFNETGSSCKIAYLDAAVLDPGDSDAETKKNISRQVHLPKINGTLVSELLDKKSVTKISKAFSGYEYGKLAEFTLMKGGILAESFGAFTFTPWNVWRPRSILVIGKPRQCEAGPKKRD